MTYWNMFVAYTGTSPGAPLVGGQDPVSQKPLEVLWAGKDLGMAQQFQDGEIRKLKITLKNPLVLDEEHRRELFGALSHARVVERVREENKSANFAFDGVVFLDTVDGMEVSDVIAVFPRTNDRGEASVDHAVKVIGKTIFIDAIDDWVTTPGFHDPKIMTPHCPWADERLAANGKAIKDNFADCFRDSKVVDEKTKQPLILYHGTSSSFEAFDPQKTGSAHFDLESGSAFFFTDDLPTANWYAKDSSKKTKGGANLIPVFLSLQNPLVVDFQGEGLEYLAEEIENARQKGCDGLIARNYDDGGVADHYIAFHPEQIKSALGNSGLYLKGSPEMDDQAAARALELANAARSAIPKIFHRGCRDERFALVG